MERVRAVDMRDLRENVGLTQAAVAAAVGCTVAAVAKWEKGKHRPLRMRAALCRLYDVSEEELLSAMHASEMRQYRRLSNAESKD